MDKVGLLRKPFGCESEYLLKSSPNILENFPYEDFRKAARKMTSPPPTRVNRPISPMFSDTLERHPFMRNVINSKGFEIKYSSPSEKEASVRKSLEEISKDIKEIEDFLTVTENIIRREKERDRELYAREKRRKLEEKQRRKSGEISSPNKENKTPSPLKKTPATSRKNSQRGITYKINSFKTKRSKPGSPRFLNSKLYFRNGKIGCLEAEQNASNIESTHALVKHILQYENEKPLVSPESVRKVLNECLLPGQVPFEEYEDSGRPLMIEARKVAQEVTFPEETDDNLSQPMENEVVEEIDCDERDVQICYNESPDLPNEEKNTAETPENILDSELVVVDNNDAQTNTIDRSTPGSLDSDGQQFLRDQVRHLVRRFTARANKVKSRLELPPTPSSSASSPSPPPPSAPVSITKQPNKGDNHSNIKILNRSHRSQFEADNPQSSLWLCSSLCGSNNDEKTLDPQGKIYISWLCVVSISFLYNAWVIPLRSTFPFQTPENTNAWLICDFCADLIYLLDVIFFKHRVMYLFEGFWVKNKNLTRKNYMRKLQFKLDLLSLLPLDLLYFQFGTSAVYWRFPRFLKIQSFWEVFKLLDRVISSPHFVRVAKTLTYMLYMIHLTACSYYAYSSYQGLGVNRWVFSGKGHPYVRCFAFATKTATSIGKNPKPEREGEYVFMTAAWLMGVFVFALLIGQIRDIISTATRNKNEYRQLEDETLEYMRRLNLPNEVQRRVKMWFKFTWDQQRTLDESNILDSLPINLKTDIAISVHIQTLSKVQLFADCEEALLRDLVLKLRAVTFLPGDYVCRKGEVGREMYIIKLGQVQVMGGPNNEIVLATLSEGSVFGEISLLGINGADRRTADVRSKGYANLFVLSKSDLNEVIVYYPNAQAILKKRARSLMRKNAAREREEARRSAMQADVVIGNPKTPETPPKLLKTVIQALSHESPAVMLITKGSKRLQRRSENKEKEHPVEPAPVAVAAAVPVEVPAPATIEETPQNSFSILNEKRPKSPDLLSLIQIELKNKNKFINLTDSEKALIISNSSSSSLSGECDVTVHNEM
ncbi:cyclic nucleotide-gated cation channel beta-3 [Episyrphus balteatus]|uniref:cyclic nucleotide-gated cation channel beta-3 n=1 Tax=Episyrphus balteatus TaxID=286459 RepID=UPI0024863772|nr:cyclic nucleotide-gated cation channel beta-3 [Episyrphus balteatus]